MLEWVSLVGHKSRLNRKFVILGRRVGLVEEHRIPEREVTQVAVLCP